MKIYIVLHMSPGVNGDAFDEVFANKNKAENYVDEQYNSKAYRIIEREVDKNETGNGK